MTVAQIMNSILQNSDSNLKKVGKTTGPFRSNLNKIPSEYTVEVTNRFKFLYRECMNNNGWKFVTLYKRR